ncbi:unnamed protein product, partial [marine sediment metagenome]
QEINNLRDDLRIIGVDANDEGWYQPIWTDETFSAFVTTETIRINTQILKIRDKAEAVCEEALKRIGLNIDLTILMNQYGRLRIMGKCPACSVTVNIIDCLVAESLRQGLRCTVCGATRWI